MSRVLLFAFYLPLRTEDLFSCHCLPGRPSLVFTSSWEGLWSQSPKFSTQMVQISNDRNQYTSRNHIVNPSSSMLWMQITRPTLFLSSGRRVLGSANKPGLPRLSRSSLNAATRTYCYMHLKMCTCTCGYNHVSTHVNPRFGWLSLPRQVLWCLAISAKESPEKIHDGPA